ASATLRSSQPGARAPHKSPKAEADRYRDAKHDTANPARSEQDGGPRRPAACLRQDRRGYDTDITGIDLLLLGNLLAARQACLVKCGLGAGLAFQVPKLDLGIVVGKDIRLLVVCLAAQHVERRARLLEIRPGKIQYPARLAVNS